MKWSCKVGQEFRGCKGPVSPFLACPYHLNEILYYSVVVKNLRPELLMLRFSQQRGIEPSPLDGAEIVHKLFDEIEMTTFLPLIANLH